MYLKYIFKKLSFKNKSHAINALMRTFFFFHSKCSPSITELAICFMNFILRLFLRYSLR